jgi:hypothetical protein
MHAQAVLVAVLAALSSAAPSKRADQGFSMVAIHSGHYNVHQRGINANGRNVWINKPTSAYCPEAAGSQCTSSKIPRSFNFSDSNRFYSTNTTTVFSATPNDAASPLAMSAIVPGGQRAFVAADDALTYTAPHTAAIPVGASQTGFLYMPQRSDGTVGTLKFNGQDWSAYPEWDAGQYKIYATSKEGFAKTGCNTVALGTTSWNSCVAWEYT